MALDELRDRAGEMADEAKRKAQDVADRAGDAIDGDDNSLDEGVRGGEARHRHDEAGVDPLDDMDPNL